MNQQEYIEKSSLTESRHPDGMHLSSKQMALLHVSMGLDTEAAEFTDQLKKHLFYGKPIDLVNLSEECGDILWYIAIACREMGIDFEFLMEQNIKKLQARFPGKFSAQHALERNLDAEREVLEQCSTATVPNGN